MADSNHMVHIAQSELQELIRQDTRSIREPKKRVIGKDSPQPHSPGMQDSLVTQTAQACVPVYYFDLLSENDVSENGEEGKDGGESSFSIYDKERYMIDLEAIGEISNTSSPFVRMGDDDDFMATVDELG